MADLTHANQWKQDFEAGIEVTMPHNGRTVRIRSISVQFLLRTGRIPDGLTEIALGATNLETDPKKNKNAIQDLKTLQNRLDDYYRVVCSEALAYPRVVDDPKKDDEIAYEWLTQHDKEFIERIIQRPVIEWRSFRLQPDADVEPVPNGTTSQATSQ